MRDLIKKKKSSWLEFLDSNIILNQLLWTTAFEFLLWFLSNKLWFLFLITTALNKIEEKNNLNKNFIFQNFATKCCICFFAENLSVVKPDVTFTLFYDVVFSKLIKILGFRKIVSFLKRSKKDTSNWIVFCFLHYLNYHY